MSTERASLLASEGRCHAQHQVTVRVTVRCEREYAHGGLHTATFDDTAIDPHFMYAISWGPKPTEDEG
jgi:hypothetical protein